MALDKNIKSAVIKALGLKDGEFDKDLYLLEDLGKDPYDVDEAAEQIKEELNINISSDEIDSWVRISDIIQSILSR